MTLLAHPQTTKQINQTIAAHPQAVALVGDYGSGKGYIAQYIASKMLESESKSLSDHPYVHMLDANKDKVGIDEVREIQTFLKLRVPGDKTKRRAVIIEGIDRLGHEAQNALLKTLEEPPKDTLIAVTIAQRNAVLPTIHSRLQHIQVLPVSERDATEFFRGTYTEVDIKRAYYMSGGEVGLMAVLLQSDADHPLVAAIAEARNLIGLTRYQRLSSVDKLLKRKDIQPALLLDGLYRLINAMYKQSLVSKSNKDLSPIVSRLAVVEDALTDLQNNVQAKLVLSRLFLRF